MRPPLESVSGSRLSKRRVGRRAKAMGARSKGSKLASSKLGRGGRPQRARAHVSAMPDVREDALALWRAATRPPFDG